MGRSRIVGARGRRQKPSAVLITRRPVWHAHRWGIGRETDNYGYESPASGDFGSFNPVEVNGVAVTDFICNAVSGVVVLQTEANVPLFGESSILVNVEGAPSETYQVDPIGPGVGFYQTTIPEMAQFVVSRYLMPSIGVNITEAT